MKKKVSSLKRGDKLTASGATIMGVYRSAKLRSGKVKVHVRYANGKESVRVWNKNTTVRVEK